MSTWRCCSGLPVEEYAAIADRLQEVGVISPSTASTLRQMARYRNRIVHFYDEITPAELYGLVTDHLDDFRRILDEVTRWLAGHRDRVREN